MNPRPILIATCCALALVAFVYFFGKQHFSLDGISDRVTPHSDPVTVSIGSTSESPYGKSDANTDEIPDDTPATNSEQTTQQPDPTVNTEISTTTQEAETPSTPSEKESANLQEYQKLMTLISDAYKNRPQREDFDGYSEYIDALLAFYDSIKPLENQVKELDYEYFSLPFWRHYFT